MIILNSGASLGISTHLFQMTKFWRLFASDYVQEFVDSLSKTTVDEIVKTFKSQFNEEINWHRQNLDNLLEQMPTF